MPLKSSTLTYNQLRPLYQELIGHLQSVIDHEDLSTDTKIYPGRLCLSFVQKAMHLNGVEVVSASAPTRLALIEIFREQWWQDYAAGLPPERYTYLSIQELAKRLEAKGFTITSIEKQVRRPLNHMQRVIPQRIYKALGLTIGRCAVIEFVDLVGFTKKPHGYRLNPLVLFLTK